MKQPIKQPIQQEGRQSAWWQWRLGRLPGLVLVLDVRLWLLLLVLVGIALRLALWQHDRGDQKVRQQDLFIARMAASPVGCAALQGGGEHRYLRVLLTGHFEPVRTLLLDNRTRDGVAGYQVVTPFRCADWDDQLVLVDRGWMPVGRDRSVLRAPVVPVGEQTLSAFVYVPEGLGTVLASTVADGWPKVVSHLDKATLTSVFDEPVYPHRLVLEAAEVRQQDSSIVYNHETTRIDADKHYGYMVQWMGIAGGVFLYGLVVSWRRGRVAPG